MMKKRLYALLLAGVLTLSLAACGNGNSGGGSGGGGNAGGSTGDTFDAGMKNQTSQSVLTLGMTQAEVEALLGEGTQEPGSVIVPGQGTLTLAPQYSLVSYGEGIEAIRVTYDNGAVAVLDVQSGEGQESLTAWGTQEGLCAGSEDKDMTALYGDGQSVALGEAIEGVSIVQYYWDKDGKVQEAWGTGGVYLQVVLNQTDGANLIQSLRLSSLAPDQELYTPES